MELTLDNGFISYHKVGNGLPLLFIHGYPLSSRMWQPQLDELSTQGTIITLDVRGHGDSYPFDGPYLMETLADDCIKVLTAAGIKPPVVVCGHSMGGYITLALYRNHPEIFTGMILTSTRAVGDSPEGKSNRDKSIKNLRDFGMDYIINAMLPKLVSPRTMSQNPTLMNTVHEIMLHTSPNGIVGALAGMRDRLDSTPILSRIQCPVMIIHGEDDQLIPITEAEQMHRSIVNSSLVKIPAAGHLPNMEQPMIFNQSVSDFLISIG